MLYVNKRVDRFQKECESTDYIYIYMQFMEISEKKTKKMITET